MYFGVTPFCFSPSSVDASASMRMPSSSSGTPTMFGADALEAVDRAGVAEFLQDHRVARIDEQAADDVDALTGARGDQHVVAR